jgi:hypothetical protein
MTVEDLLPEILRAIRADGDATRDAVRDLTRRVARVESGVAKLIHESADHIDTAVEQEHRIDGLAQRIERIERRLQLVE